MVLPKLILFLLVFFYVNSKIAHACPQGCQADSLKIADKNAVLKPANSTYAHGANILVGCRTGFKPSEQIILVCKNETFEKANQLPKKVCFKTCDKPLLSGFENGKVSPDRAVYAHKEIFAVECIDGFTFQASIPNRFMCRNGAFHPNETVMENLKPCRKGCALPDLNGTGLFLQPDTAFLDHGDAVLLSCEQSGYSPTHNTATCSDGELDPRLDYTCYKDCEVKSQTSNYQARASQKGLSINFTGDKPEKKIRHGWAVQLSCNQGYSTPRDRVTSSVCKDGSFGANFDFACYKDCMVPSKPANIEQPETTTDKFVYGDTITYTCKKGFSPVSDATTASSIERAGFYSRQEALTNPSWTIECGSNGRIHFENSALKKDINCQPVEHRNVIGQSLRESIVEDVDLERIRKEVELAFKSIAGTSLTRIQAFFPNKLTSSTHKRSIQKAKNFLQIIITFSSPKSDSDLILGFLEHVKKFPISGLKGAPFSEPCNSASVNGFTFKETTRYEIARSNKECSNDDRPLATVKCSKKVQRQAMRDQDGKLIVAVFQRSFFDDETLIKTNCSKVVTITTLENTSVEAGNIEEVSSELLQVTTADATGANLTDAVSTQRIVNVLSRIGLAAAEVKTVSERTLLSVTKVSAVVEATLDLAERNDDDDDVTASEESRGRVRRTLEAMIGKVELERPIEIRTNEIKIKVQRPPADADQVTYQPLGGDASDPGPLLRITAQLPDGSRDGDVRLSFVHFANDELFSRQDTVEEVISVRLMRMGTGEVVAGARSAPQKDAAGGVKINTNVTIVYSSQPQAYGKTINRNLTTSFRVQKCSFWDEEEETWSTTGCCLDGRQSPPVCKCSHTTNFALVVTSQPIPNDFELAIFSDIGLVFSVLGIFFTFVIYVSNKKLREKEWTKIQLNIYANMLASYVLFLTGVDKVANIELCNAVTFLLQFTLLATWCWIAVYGRKLYTSLVKIFGGSNGRFFTQASMFAYGLPFTATLLNSLIAWKHSDKEFEVDFCQQQEATEAEVYRSNYRGVHLCWLHRYSLYFGFLLIVAAVLIHNLVVLITVMRSTTKRKVTSSRKKSDKENVTRAMTLMVTLGLGWLFGIFMLFSTDPSYQLAFSWIFTLVNGFQGVFIFYIFCVRPKNVLEIWWQPISNAVAIKSSQRERSQSLATFSVSTRTAVIRQANTLPR